MEIKRRDFNGLIASLALVPLCGGQSLELTEEWVVGLKPNIEGFIVKVWSDNSITAHRGTTQLKSKELANGWFEFFGGTKEWQAILKVRHLRKEVLDVDYFAFRESGEPIRFGNFPLEFAS